MNGTQALVLAGHGSQHHPRSAAPVHDHADRIRGAGPFHEVRTAFWKEEPTLRDVATTVESDVAYVVPVLTSEGYFAEEVFPREVGVDEDGPGRSGPAIRYAEPVGTHPEMTHVIEERVESTRDGPADGVGVVVVGHGTERNERSGRSTRRHAARLRERGRYAGVVAAFLDEPPHVGDALGRVPAGEVVVVPLFVADGHHTTADVPAALGHPGIGEVAEIDGRRVHYTGAVGTEPRLADVIVGRAVEAGADPGADPTPPGRSEAGEAFLRRLDAAGGPVEWGELLVVPGDGGYGLRHRSDAGAPRSSLASVEGPAGLREHVRRDDDGRYRPLSGAETLPTGWATTGLDGPGLVRAVDAVYPGTVAHWYRERRGELPVTHLPETIDRQTGFYADLDRLDAGQLAAVAEAVCGDCVRSRRWRVDDAGAAADTGGDIPCREACPVFLSAAHALSESGPDASETADPDVPVGDLSDPENRYRVGIARALDGRTPADPAAVPTGGDGR